MRLFVSRSVNGNQGPTLKTNKQRLVISRRAPLFVELICHWRQWLTKQGTIFICEFIESQKSFVCGESRSGLYTGLSSIQKIKLRTNIVPALAAVSDVNILAPDSRHPWHGTGRQKRSTPHAPRSRLDTAVTQPSITLDPGRYSTSGNRK